MIRLVLILSFFILVNTRVISAQAVSMQFMQTEYDIKGLHMIDASKGVAVGEVHWDQSLKAYRSTILNTSDGGLTWHPRDVSASTDLWDVHFSDSDHGWCAGDSGLILHSVDGGASWTKQDIGTIMDFKSLFFPDAYNGWAVANEEIHYLFDEPDAWKSWVWHTSNGGASWVEQDLPDDAGLIHSVYFKNDLEGWALGVKNENINGFVETRCAAYYTGDGGETWIEKYSPDLKLVFTDIDFPDEAHGYMVGFASNSSETGGSIFRTSDGGDSWQRAANNDVFWEVDFVDSLKGYAAGADYLSAWGPPVYRTMDGGDTWQKIRMEEHDNQGLYGLAVFGDKVMGLGDDGYMIRSADPWGDHDTLTGGGLFTQVLIDTLYQFEDVFFVTPELGWTVGQKSAGPDEWKQVIMHTDDGGWHWREQYSFRSDGWLSNTLRLNAVQFVNEATGWAVGHVVDVGALQTSGILFTSDGGTTWTQQAQGISEGQIVDLFFFDGQNGWALTDASTYPGSYIQLLKTTDGGINWEMISTGREGLITIGYAIKTGTLSFVDESTGWILGAQCVLLKTEDGGKTWMEISLPREYMNTFDISFSDDQNGTICGETVFNTIDGGETWTEDQLNDVTFTDLCFTDSIHGWMVGEWGKVNRSSDGGTLWEEVIHDATNAALKSVSFPDDNNGWAVGRAGTIIRIDNSAVTSSHQPYISDHPAILFQNNPNPFRSQTEIRFRIIEQGTVSLSVYDLSGRKIITLIEGFRVKGIHKVIWDRQDTNNLPVRPGVYIYRLVTSEGIYSKIMEVL